MELHDNDYEIVYLFIVYTFFCIGLICFADGYIHRNYIAILGFIIFKMITLYDKCTISYIECKLRKVKKEEGYLNDFLDSIVKLRYTPHAKFIYLISAVFILTFIKQELIT